jgi:hypothetical protein
MPRVKLLASNTKHAYDLLQHIAEKRVLVACMVESAVAKSSPWQRDDEREQEIEYCEFIRVDKHRHNAIVRRAAHSRMHTCKFIGEVQRCVSNSNTFVIEITIPNTQ